jgi:hypothetical protein
MEFSWLFGSFTHFSRSLTDMGSGSSSSKFMALVDTERGVNQYQVQFKNLFNLYLNHSIISNEK